MAQQNSATEVERTLGRMDLMAIAVGQIIGAGVMVMSIAAMKMVNIAFMIAAVFTIFKTFPTLFVSSIIRLKGGAYTQAIIFVSESYAGFTKFVGLLGTVSMAMFAVGLTSYIGMLVPGIKEHEVWFPLQYLHFSLFLTFSVRRGWPRPKALCSISRLLRCLYSPSLDCQRFTGADISAISCLTSRCSTTE